MGSLFLPEVGLDCKFSSKPIDRFLPDVSKIHSVSDKILKLDDYVNRLQDEMKKIDGFKRELPLCMDLLRHAISAALEELAQCKRLKQAVPVLEEFIPLNKTITEEKVIKAENSKQVDNNNKDKMNWMSSVQLWSADNNCANADLSHKQSLKVLENNKKGKEEEELKKPVMDNLFQSGKNREVERAFVPFKGCHNFSVMAAGKECMDESQGLSLCTPGIKNSRRDGGIKHVGFNLKSSYSGATNFKAGQQQAGRKQRRCWSVELHRQFMNALDHLGGPKVATPKQIREHMQVNGLTNDEVKSHLQKYRLHIERAKSNSNYSESGGYWASQEDAGEFLKQRNSKSDSPDGPLQLFNGNEVDDEDDAKSGSIQG